MNASEAERLNTMGTPNGDNTQAAADSIKVVSSTPSAGPIGVFDSGYGGLTILHEMRSLLPQYDYLYLGDNARAPYGPRSFDVVYQFTREAVIKLFLHGLPSRHIGLQYGVSQGPAHHPAERPSTH